MKKLTMWKRMLPCLAAWAMALFGAALHTAAAAAPVQGNAGCLGEAAEAALRQRETALLGAMHANDHADARGYRCQALQAGPGAQLADATPAAAVSGAPADVGSWSAPFGIPVAGITSVLLHTGKVLFWSYDPANSSTAGSSNTGVAMVWDPVTRAGTAVTPPENIWCGGQTILADGRVFVAGGNLRYPDPSAPAGQTGFQGALSSYTFHPLSQTWTRQPDMANGRWYPTVTKLADNRVAIASGYDETGSEAINQAIEIFTPAADPDGTGTMSTVAIHNASGLYPLQFLMPSGQVLQAGPPWNNTVLFTPQASGTWPVSAVPPMLASHYNFGNGISVTDAARTPAKQLVMVAGGANNSVVGTNNEWLDGMNPGAGWKPYPRWLQARHNANTVILPDGTLFTVGGNSSGGTYGSPLLESELYNKSAEDTTGLWVSMAPNSIPAAYHSSAILLPDATVLLSEDDRDPAQASLHRAQVYSPPYLFRGARPKIQDGPSTVAAGGSYAFFIDDGKKIVGATLVAPGAVTHANDMHQRLVRLAHVQKGREVRITVPASKALLPPGYYMLFLISERGVPSAARFVRVQ
ncbi:galactose oxidase-like domain-containing protein [Massilia sp. Root418]|uniref:galactose oxidase-like domain-containing protein n=1 Tax=Massilia sp. Root418 TaxID=1736532 RepID=UPI000AFBEBF5|nr:galactose oxidase-like domain-containing protein [Massilia sp. Root418]